MALDIVTEKKVENNTSQHEPAATEDIKIENLIISKTVGTGAEYYIRTLAILPNVYILGKFSRVVLSRHETTKQYLALQIIAMEDVNRLKQVEHVHNEKNILKSISHPFLISLISSSMDTRFLYLMFPYVPGGELFSYLRSMNRFPSSTALFYTAEVVSVLGFLNSLNII